MNISQTLHSLQLTSDKTKEVFAKKTRDNDNLVVYRDAVSGVIFIEDFYVGSDVYQSGDYRQDLLGLLGTTDYDRQRDYERRRDELEAFITGKTLLDFGCGRGDFLINTNHMTKQSTGIELEERYVELLNSKNIDCFLNVEAIDNSSVDVCTLFHVLEHLPDPITILAQLKSKLTDKGLIYIEVPHANDFLLTKLNCESFKNFTLWSQHLILHTRESLRRLLEYVGFNDVIIKGEQRYNLANHLTWLTEGKPGGHKSSLSIIENQLLYDAYKNALSSIDSTDTLVAIAKA